ncbi:MAG: hypothetical protein K2F84_05830 [Bacteroidales bacterium]|nr:hypothetical protein [Bacteroidales bacterium]
MLIRLCKNNSAKQGLFLFILSLCLWSKFFFATGFGDYRVYLLWLLVLVESGFVTFILNRHKLSKNSLFVAVVYLLGRTVFGFATGADGLSDSLTLSAMTCLPFLLLWAAYYFLRMYEAEFSLPALLNGAVLWSVATLVCPTIIYTLPCIFLILLVYSANRGRVWGVAILGMALPFALMGIRDFLRDTDWLTGWYTQVPAFLPESLPLPPDRLPFYFALVLLITAFFGWVYLKQNPIEGEILERKRASAIAAAFIYFVLYFGLVTADPAITTVPLLFSTAYLTGDYFTRKKETLLSEGLFLVLVVLGLLSVWL